MSEHTPPPWRIEGHCSRPLDGRPKGHRIVSDRGDGFEYHIAAVGTHPGINAEGAKANAAFIVKAVNAHEALLEFFKWAMRDGPWEGGDLDGGSIQDKAESLGLIVKTKYDIAKHGPEHGDFCEGDDFYEFAPHLNGRVGLPKT